MAGDEYPEETSAIKALYMSPEAVADGIRCMEESVQTFTLSNGARFTVYASPYTPEFCDWGFAYPRDEDRFNSSPTVSSGGYPVPDFPGVDIMITHGPPQGVLDEVEGGVGWNGMHVGCEHLWEAVKRARPRLYVFGHIHEGWGAEKWMWRSTLQQLMGFGLQSNGRRVKRWDADVPVEEKEQWVREKGRFIDLSGVGEEEDTVVHGESTVFVNASIMDVNYRPINAPWVVDLDLPLEMSEGR